MNYPQHIRLAAALDAAEGRARAALRKQYSSQSADDAELAAILADADGIRERFDSLTDTARGLLVLLLQASPGLPALPIDDRAVEAQLTSSALVFRDGRRETAGTLIVPLEVRAALLRYTGPDRALLAALLADRSHEDLAALAELHGVAVDDLGDTFGLAVSIAEALLDDVRMANLWESLQPAARSLVVWLAEHERALPEAVVVAYAEQLGQRSAENGRPDRVPLRVGLVQSHETDEGTVLVVPPDVFDALFPILEEQLTERCGEAWDLLRDHGRPALRDSLARGAGGDPLHVFRYRLVLAIAADTRHDDAIDNILCRFDILDPEHNDLGKQASLHLDVSTPDSFARQLLLSWLHMQRDPYTARILAAIGIDLDAIMEALAIDASAELDGDIVEQRRRAWELLFFARAALIIMLSVLPETTWHRIDDLARAYLCVFMRISLQFGSFLALPALAESPRPPRALIEMGVESTPELTVALLDVMRSLIEPIGGVRVHPSEQMFTTNSEALRIIDDGAPLPSDALAIVESFIGDDGSAWLPLPTELGIRPSGLCAMQFLPAGTLAVEAGAHVHDLVRLAQWAHPVFDADRIVFVFSESTVERSDTFDADPEEFLTWLALRVAGEIPGRIRALFPLDSSAVDLGRRSALNAGKRRVQQLVRRLGQWGERPPLTFVEELRGWGAAAAEVLRDLCTELVRKQAWDRPMLRHAVTLLGELGDVAALPSLLRCVAYCDDPELEAASAMACARLGEPACDGLLALLGNEGAEPEKRLISANALAAVCVLQPHLGDRIARAFFAVIEKSTELEPDIATILAINLAETGHPDGAALIDKVRDSGMWAGDVMPPEDAQWIVEIAPAAWGHHIYGVPLAALYPDPAESERLSDDLGIKRLLEESGVSSTRIHAAMTGGAPRRRRRDD
jgi:hypothetical protein